MTPQNAAFQNKPAEELRALSATFKVSHAQQWERKAKVLNVTK